MINEGIIALKQHASNIPTSGYLSFNNKRHPIPDRKQSQDQGPTSQRPWKPKLVIFRRGAVEQERRGEKQTLHNQFSVKWDLRQTYQ